MPPPRCRRSSPRPPRGSTGPLERHHGVDRVELAVPASSMTVRAIHLDHVIALPAVLGASPATQAPMALHADTACRTSTATRAARRPDGCRGERLDAEHSKVGVQRGRDVLVRVSTPPVIGPVLTMVIAIPSQLKWAKGWEARPGNETVLRRTDRSITFPNHGPCPLTGPADTDRQTGPQVDEAVDHHQVCTPACSLGILCGAGTLLDPRCESHRSCDDSRPRRPYLQPGSDNRHTFQGASR
jgi:hypothetical protein